MVRTGPGRVVVGVASSPAGLQALRTAMGRARLLGRELLAVRAYPPPADRGSADHILWTAHGSYVVPPQPSVPVITGEQHAHEVIRSALSRALGGAAPDIPVRPVAVMDSPGSALLSIAYRGEDLLVVGAASPRRLRWFHRFVGRYCAARATCSVLLVPPQGHPAGDGCTHQEGATTMRRSSAKPTACGGAETLWWPERACCCSAPPMVEVLMPPVRRAGHAVDLYLCAHHYRASLGPLALAGAIAHFRERPSTVSLVEQRER